MIIPVILSGGGGTRLWPMSTPEKPKQFLPLTGDATMFQMTLARVMDRDFFAPPIIVGNAAHADTIERQLADAGVEGATIILEPSARNTAPAIALAALAAAGQNAQATLLVMPSDHIIADVAAFHAATMAALPLVQKGWMVTYGIEPTGPETGYGYIRMGEFLENGLQHVANFVEKPDIASAQSMLDAGNHAWNGGIFLFQADVYLQHLTNFAKDIASAASDAFAKATRDGRFITPDPEHFSGSPSDSIDYAVMEKADRVAVAPVSMGWSDVGSWDALYAIGEKNAENNQLHGPNRLIDTENCLIHSDGIRISTAGINDLIIVASGNEVMIVPRGHSQDVKKLSS